LSTGKAISGLVEKSFKKAKPTEAVNASKTTPGLHYNYYEGKWTLLSDFSALKPISSGVAKTIELAMKKRNENYGVVFTGYLHVPETGVYQFTLTSDDGYRMIISGNTPLNDGRHGMEDKIMDVALSKGLHSIEIQFFQNGGGDGLELKWKTNHKASEVIAAENFPH